MTSVRTCPDARRPPTPGARRIGVSDSPSVDGSRVVIGRDWTTNSSSPTNAHSMSCGLPWCRSMSRPRLATRATSSSVGTRRQPSAGSSSLTTLPSGPAVMRTDWHPIHLAQHRRCPIDVVRVRFDPARHHHLAEAECRLDQDLLTQSGVDREHHAGSVRGDRLLDDHGDRRLIQQLANHAVRNDTFAEQRCPAVGDPLEEFWTSDI